MLNKTTTSFIEKANEKQHRSRKKIGGNCKLTIKRNREE